jgi:hypothetical protein
MPQLYHKHDIQARITYSPSTNSYWNKTILRDINLSPGLLNINSPGVVYSYYPPYAGGYFQSISDSYIQAGYLYPGYTKGNTGHPTYSPIYITGTKWLAILDVFQTKRYTILSTSTYFGFPQANPYYATTYDNWVAWAIYDTATGQFTGNYCSDSNSARLKFNLTPLASFPDTVSQFDITQGVGWQTKTGTSAPTSNFSTSFFTLKSGTTLGASGQTIRINAGHPTNQFTIKGKNMRFHGFISYSGVFSTTTYAFVTLKTLDTVNSVAKNNKWGYSQYPLRNAQVITHIPIPICRLTSGTAVTVGSHTSGVTNVFYSASGSDGFVGGGNVTPITVSTLHPYPYEYTTVSDINDAPINVPNWMTENIFKDETAVYLESDGGNVDYFDTGYYGSDSVFAFWDLDTQTWSGYTGYGGGPSYYTFILSDFLGGEGIDPMGLCGIPNIPFNTTVYTSTSNISTLGTVFYTDTSLSTPYNGPQRGWYRIADSTGTELTPITLYLIDNNTGALLNLMGCR